MKKELKTLWIAVVVLAVLQLIGGTIYTAATAANEKNFTYVDCTVLSVQSKQEEDTLIVTGITVSYTDDAGNAVVAEMADFPASFSVGSVFEGRYSDDPLLISAETTDWFTPVFLIVLGAAYGLFALITWSLRKKMGLYAMEDISEEPIFDEEMECTCGEESSAKIETRGKCYENQ